MKYRPLGETGIDVSIICLGTMTFGEQNTEAEAHQQLDYAFDHGVNFIDTAQMYPTPPRAETQGDTEAFIGSWLKARRRDDVVLATKIAGPGLPTVPGHPYRLNEEHIRRGIEGSLRGTYPPGDRGQPEAPADRLCGPLPGALAGPAQQPLWPVWLQAGD
jgi:aryl-alcohol dehydrogenase-like predicted oxidoreductase